MKAFPYMKSTQANPAWGERMNLGYRDMILNGELTPLGKLSSSFLAPKDSQHLLFAYYESSLVIDFIVQKFGLGIGAKILTDLGDSAKTSTSPSQNTRFRCRDWKSNSPPTRPTWPKILRPE